MANPRMLAPTAIPAFAPVERPSVSEAVVVDDEVAAGGGESRVEVVEGDDSVTNVVGVDWVGV